MLRAWQLQQSRQISSPGDKDDDDKGDRCFGERAEKGWATTVSFWQQWLIATAANHI